MRLLVVSNRLNITVVEKQGRLTFEDSVGGVATGLRAYLESQNDFPYTWIGWPGGTVEENLKASLSWEAFEKFRAHPVFLAEEDMEKFYHGFCNKTIWALFHYFPSYAVYDEEYWQQYQQVNQMYCNAVAEIAEADDIVWIHDYHLMLLPQMLRKRMPKLAIGFFLHIPFPSFEIFRLLPSAWRTQILKGLLGADLVGFHTQEYSQYFQRCVQRFLGYENKMGDIFTGSGVTRVDTFPMGIDFQRFHDASAAPEVLAQCDQLKSTLGDSKIILSVDRLDYSKGILHRLRAYEHFLDHNPEWQAKVTLVLIVVPSRVGVEHYQAMKKQIDELVGRINGRFGRISWSPILYQYRTLVFQPLVALYCVSDIMLVTPLRDGMNLIAKEYLASRNNQTGVLILSEMAGAAKELTEAIVINPNNIEEISQALKEALVMLPDQQIQRNKQMQVRLKRYDLTRWAGDFLQSLISSKERRFKLENKLLNPMMDGLMHQYSAAHSRLLLLDYDGTLVPFAAEPNLAQPGSDVLSVLAGLSADEANRVVIVSGRERRVLDQWFGNLPVGMIAEHGVWIRNPDCNWRLSKPIQNWWKTRVLSLMEPIVDRLPGSMIEEKEFSLVFHFRKSDPDLASIRTRELSDLLTRAIGDMDLEILAGNKVLEVRSIRVNKGISAMQFLTGPNRIDFVLAIGDDLTDEDLFRALPQSAFTIHVGLTPSDARYHLRSPDEVLHLLSKLEEHSYSHQSNQP